jgi:hypothetical protein
MVFVSLMTSSQAYLTHSTRYFSLFITYTPYTIYKCEPCSILVEPESNPYTDGFKGWGKMILKDGWKCEIALCTQGTL